MPKILGTEDLRARIRKDPAGVYFFFGEEERLKQMYLARLQESVENAAFNTAKLTLSDAPLAALEAEISVLPFLSERRFVRVDGLITAKLSASQEARFFALLENAPAYLILVFFFPAASVPDAKLQESTLFSGLPENVCAVRFARRTAAELVRYMDGRFQKRGISVPEQVLRELVLRCDQDMTHLERAGETLIAYAAAKKEPITIKTVDAFLPEKLDSRLYRLSDAVQAANAAAALSEYASLRAQDTDEYRICATVARAVGILHALRTADRDTALSVLGVKSFRYGDMAAQARRVSSAAFCEASALCLDADAKLKNTSLNPDVVLQELIVRVCGILKQGA